MSLNLENSHFVPFVQKDFSRKIAFSHSSQFNFSYLSFHSQLFTSMISFSWKHRDCHKRFSTMSLQPFSILDRNILVFFSLKTALISKFRPKNEILQQSWAHKCLGFVLYNLYIYSLLVCLFVCPFESNKRKNGWTDLAEHFCGNSQDLSYIWKVYECSELQKFVSKKILIFVKFFKSTNNYY